MVDEIEETEEVIIPKDEPLEGDELPEEKEPEIEEEEPDTTAF